MIRAHFAQTAHSEKTAREKIIQERDKRREIFLLDIYSKRLEQCSNEEDGSEAKSVVSSPIVDDSDLEAPQQLNEPSALPTPHEKTASCDAVQLDSRHAPISSIFVPTRVIYPASLSWSSEPLVVDMPGGHHFTWYASV